MVLRWPQHKGFPLPATKAFQFRFIRGHGHRDAWQGPGLAREDKGQRGNRCGVGLRRWRNTDLLGVA